MDDFSSGAASLFRTIAELEGGAAFIVDAASGRLSYISPSIEALTGYAPAALAAHIDGSAVDALLAPLCRVLAVPPKGKLPARQEVELARKGGGTVPLEVVVTCADGYTAGLVRDISGQREYAARQKKFASMLNHEFRTPLSTIDGAVQMLEASPDAAKVSDATRQRYRKIQIAADRLIGMLDEYLSPDRMAAVGRDKQATTVEPLALLREAAQHARAAGRKVDVDGATLPLTLRGSPEGLAMALKVLVDNAIQYTPDSATIHLEGRRDGNVVELAVRDEGPGIPENEWPLVFAKGFRGASATGRAGSGLGLYMAKSVVEVHGGTISGQNNAQYGAVFKIRMPL
ncbi:PAS domain-containing sensor histidine kinase [Massilia arenosa]|uniref:histidine kinase n=1 Tax=Zemynaea arenosa TaxID=2561931 RepID=A0A4Y9RRA8_9BURK|nr:PAS domain-containing sensor histidine kinase [Massilia arenosa]TFW10811.1 PAS domain-containing sensor histidine kinase [Massilia arenosa]